MTDLVEPMARAICVARFGPLESGSWFKRDEGEKDDLRRDAKAALAIVQERMERMEGALNGMLDFYGPPGKLRNTLDYPPEHPISKARAALASPIKDEVR